MKLSELTGYKSNPVYQDIRQNFAGLTSQTPSKTRLRILEEFERKLIEHGFKSHGMGAYGIVFSQADYPWVFKIFSNDPGYLSFLRYAKRKQDNPYIPKIKGHWREIVPGTFVVRLEKLTPIKRKDYADFIERVVFLTSHADIVQNRKEMQEVERMFPGIVHTLDDIIQLPGRHEFDLHSGNFMLRGGQLVIADPLVSDDLMEDNKFKGTRIAKHYGGFNGRPIPAELRDFITRHTHHGKYVIEYSDSWYARTFDDSMGIHSFKTFMDVIKPYFTVMRIGR